MLAFVPFLRLLKVPPLRVLRRELEAGIPPWLTVPVGLIGLFALVWGFTADIRLACGLIGGMGVLMALLALLASVLLRLGSRLKGPHALRLAINHLSRERGSGLFQLAGFALALMLFGLLWAARVDLLEDFSTRLPADAPLRDAVCLTLLVSVQLDEHGAASWRYAPEMLPQVEAIAARALAALAALLSLVLTTPLPDLIGLLRRLRTPEILLDLMVLCYRMLFVFSATTRDIVSAQDARLGYSTRRRGLRSLGQLIASLSLGIWLRARALHRAALARNGDGPLRFLTPVYPQAGRDRLIALLAGGSLIVAAMRLGA